MPSRALLSVVAFLLFGLADCSNKPASDSAANSAANPADQNAPAGATSGNMADSRRSPVVKEAVVVPAGTTLTVRLGESLGSKLSSPGQSFSATLVSPITVDGNTVIPAGAQARGTVVDAKAVGRFKGGALLELRLNSITVNGSEQRIKTSAVTRTLKGKGKRTAVKAGGGTALGAIIGGLAGGGKGAAIGAAAGAGAGTGGAAFTGNKEIVLPAESALSFRLTSPLEVNAGR